MNAVAIIQGFSVMVVAAVVAGYFAWAIQHIVGQITAAECPFVPDLADVVADVTAVDEPMRKAIL